jgi:hypothetical protein
MRAGRLWGMGLAAFLLFGGVSRGQDSLNVTRLAQLYDFWEWVYDLAVSGNYVYIADGNRGLQILDFSTPTAPQQLLRMPLPGCITELAVASALLCTGGVPFEIRILDISNPAAPLMLGSCQATYEEFTLDIQDDFLYVCNRSGPLEIFDLSDPTQPQLTGSLNLGYFANGLDVSDRYAYVIGSFGLKIVDVFDPSQPFLVGIAPAQLGSGNEIIVQGVYAYVTSDSLMIFDVGNPTAPILIGTCGLPMECGALELAGNYAYVGGLFWGGLSVVDVSNPTLPAEVGYYQTDDRIWGLSICQGYLIADGIEAGLLLFDISDPRNPVPASECSYWGSLQHVIYSNGTLYLADYFSGLRVVDVSNPAQPQEIGRFDTLAEVWNLELSENYIYALGGDEDPPHHIWTVDVSDPTDPLLVNTLTLDLHGVSDLSASGSLLGLAAVWAGLLVYDITIPAAPVLVGSYWLGEEKACCNILLSGDIAYAGIWGGETEQLHILDVSAPAQPHLLSTLDIKVYGMDISGNYLYVATGDDQSVVVMDVSDPTRPAIVSTYQTEFLPRSICFQWEYLYVATMGEGLRILDVRDPANPVETGWYVMEDEIQAAAACGTLAFTAQEHSLVIYDCSEAVPVAPGLEPIPPSSFRLHPCHPNPFNPTTILSFDLPLASLVKLEVFDTNGRSVGAHCVRPSASEATPTMYPAGTHQIPFDGSSLPSGIYLARLTVGDWQQTQKLVLLK